MSDPNWLLSTSVQSAAAIVGLIGGFLVSRMLTLSSEKAGLQNKLSEVKSELELKLKSLEKLKSKREKKEQNDNNKQPNAPDYIAMQSPAQLAGAQLQASENSALAKEYRLTNTECDLLKAKEKDLVDKLRVIGKPKGLGWGITVLICFSVTGILIPLSMLPASESSFTEEQKWIIFGLFTIGMIAVFTYLIVSIRNLSKE